ncbi:hypothetical protein M1506_01015 [Patescibacteria group bacterium]|nr:hypothetical protein [Patescibacteria group bacterium]
MQNKEKHEDFLAKIQNKDEKTRRKYLYLASSISMFLVIFLWIVYLDYAVPSVQSNVASSTAETSTQNFLPAANQSAGQNSFFDTLSNGFSNISGSTKNALGDALNSLKTSITGLFNNVRGELNKTNSFTLENSSSTTTEPNEPTTTIQAVPTTTLP